MVAILNHPSATVWITHKTPIKLTPSWNSTTQSFAPPFGGSECISELQTATTTSSLVPPYKVDKLFQVEIKPYGLEQFTGKAQSSITEQDIKNSIGKFPMRLFSVFPRSVGRTLSLDEKQSYAEIRNCEYQSGKIRCDGIGLPRIDEVTQLRADFSFALALANTANVGLGTIRPLRYELRLETMHASNTCQLNDCAFLKMVDRSSIPFRVELAGGSKEDFTSLSDLSYSWIKNLSLSQIRFRLSYENGGDYFDVSFR